MALKEATRIVSNIKIAIFINRQKYKKVYHYFLNTVYILRSLVWKEDFKLLLNFSKWKCQNHCLIKKVSIASIESIDRSIERINFCSIPQMCMLCMILLLKVCDLTVNWRQRTNWVSVKNMLKTSIFCFWNST